MRAKRDQEYERRERALFQRELDAIERAPLADRREACRALYEVMRSNPDLVAERMSWLFDGHYGQGAYLVAREVLDRPRMNKAAWLTSTIGALEWQCPIRMVQQAWKRLSPSEKAGLQRAVERVIRETLTETANGRDRRQPSRRLRSMYAHQGRDRLPSTPAGARAYKARIDAMMRRSRRA